MRFIKNKTLKFIICVFLMGFSYTSHAQTNIYDIVFKKDTIGILKVSKNIKDDVILYSYYLDVQVKLLVSIHLKYNLKATYTAEQLIHASVDNTVNNKEHHSSDIQWKDSYYLINSKNKKNHKLENKITYSGVKLFFEEPNTIKKIFSEHSAQYGILSRIGENYYELTLHNGKKNQYLYKKGVLVKASINNSFIQFQLLLRD
ncbi:DUF6134 family protein [Aquimarina muelleri]|nr:DUF6134 family protein [Aquimarina muelleri]MCX2764097.1 hypothetical protein [Aquimarina muelleri]